MTDWKYFFQIIDQQCEAWSASPDSRFLWIYQMIQVNRSRIEYAWWQHECTNSTALFLRLIKEVMPESDWQETPDKIGLTPTYKRVYGDLVKAMAFRRLRDERAA